MPTHTRVHAHAYAYTHIQKKYINYVGIEGRCKDGQSLQAKLFYGYSVPEQKQSRENMEHGDPCCGWMIPWLRTFWMRNAIQARSTVSRQGEHERWEMFQSCCEDTEHFRG